MTLKMSKYVAWCNVRFKYEQRILFGIVIVPFVNNPCVINKYFTGHYKHVSIFQGLLEK